MTKKRLILISLLGLVAAGIIFGDRTHIKYLSELYIMPIIETIISQ